MRTEIFFICLLFIAPDLFAQYSDSVHYYAGATSTGTINKTNNTSSYVLNNALKLGVRRKDISLNLSNSWVYGDQQKTLTNNDYNSTLDFNLYKGPEHFYYWGLGNYTSSYSLKINNQYQGGLGVAYNIIDRKNARLNVSDGMLYEQSDIYLQDIVRDKYSTFRNSFRLAFKWDIKQVFSISGMTFYQNSLSSKTDYIIRSNVALGVKVFKEFSLTAAFTYNRFNRTQKETTLFTYGLTLEKYF